MLFLTRKIGESVIINENVEVTVVKINRSAVKLSFTYPEATQILRKEVFLRIQDENKMAAQSVSVLKDNLENVKDIADQPFFKKTNLKLNTQQNLNDINKNPIESDDPNEKND